MKIIGVVNQKGGVGKTTTSVNLASYLAIGGRKVLLVDLDPQANASSGLGVRGAETGAYDVLVDGLPLGDAVVGTAQENLSLLASTTDLAGAAVELSDRPSRLREVLSAAQGFDLIVVDAPPSLGPLAINALVAAEGLIIPLQAEYYALEGVAGLLDTVDRVRAALNPSLRILGILITMFDNRTNLAQQVEENVRNHFGELAFWSVIPRNVRLSEAPSYGKAIHQYAPTSTGAVAYRRLAEEVMQRVQKA